MKDQSTENPFRDFIIEGGIRDANELISFMKETNRFKYKYSVYEIWAAYGHLLDNLYGNFNTRILAGRLNKIVENQPGESNRRGIALQEVMKWLAGSYRE